MRKIDEYEALKTEIEALSPVSCTRVSMIPEVLAASEMAGKCQPYLQVVRLQAVWQKRREVQATGWQD